MATNVQKSPTRFGSSFCPDVTLFLLNESPKLVHLNPAAPEVPKLGVHQGLAPVADPEH